MSPLCLCGQPKVCGCKGEKRIPEIPEAKELKKAKKEKSK